MAAGNAFNLKGEPLAFRAAAVDRVMDATERPMTAAQEALGQEIVPHTPGAVGPVAGSKALPNLR